MMSELKRENDRLKKYIVFTEDKNKALRNAALSELNEDKDERSLLVSNIEKRTRGQGSSDVDPLRIIDFLFEK